jgi:hypothetical protein
MKTAMFEQAGESVKITRIDPVTVFIHQAQYGLPLFAHSG